MAFPLFTFKEFVKYHLRAVGPHSLHSPFVFDLYNQVIRKRIPDQELRAIRKQIFNNCDRITYLDPGTGEMRHGSIGEVTRRSASSHRFSMFLIKLIDYLKIERVLETGTSVGLNSLYLAHSYARQVCTIEGSPVLAQFAKRQFERLAKGHIRVVEGLVQNVFPDTLRQFQPDLIFLDADHRKETIDYYMKEIQRFPSPGRCMVIHDIHWSAGMKEAWMQIVSDQTCSLTIDIFQAGIIFPDYPIEKQHFVIKF